MPDRNATWYILADGKQVRVLQKTGHGVEELQRFDAKGHGDPAHDADDTVAHIQSPSSDPHDQAKAHFAKHVAKHINDAVAQQEVKHFHLAAATTVMHDIMGSLTKQSQDAMVSHQAKDLIHIAPSDINDHFPAA